MLKHLLLLSLLCTALSIDAVSAPAGKCFCSRICDYRDQKPDDKPVIDEENGIKFCKIWDKNNYKKRCLAKRRGR
jgi:hypothetical protein